MTAYWVGPSLPSWAFTGGQPESPPSGTATPCPCRSPAASWGVALDRKASDSYHGVIDLSPIDVGDAIQLDLVREWQQNSLTIHESFRSWQLSIKRLRKSHGGMVNLLVEHVPPDLTPGGPAASGYTFSVHGMRLKGKLLLMVDLVWPQSAQVANYLGPRNPALYNRCRWDVGPLAAPPRPGTNEADC